MVWQVAMLDVLRNISVVCFCMNPDTTNTLPAAVLASICHRHFPAAYCWAIPQIRLPHLAPNKVSHTISQIYQHFAFFAVFKP